MKKLNSSKGFTLIEVLIVVAIIAIIVGIGVPALRNARENAVNAKRGALLSNVATAKTRVLLDGGSLSGSNDFAAIAPYILVRGVPPTHIENLTEGLPSGNLVIGDKDTAPNYVQD